MRKQGAQNAASARAFSRLSARFLPFADAATEDMPIGRLLRLSLFQVSVGMTAALLTGALNRVMIVELATPAWIVGLMISLPLAFAPLRALVGHRSDHHRSAFGWRRSPFIWFGSLLQFGGLAIMPFALLILGDDSAPSWVGQLSAALAFLLVGAGVHTTQTAGLALASDLTTDENRPRAVALLYVMLLIGMAASAALFGALLANYTEIALIRVVQGAAVAAIALNCIALWKQETRSPGPMSSIGAQPTLSRSWRKLASLSQSKRLLVAVALGGAGFSMQEVLLEPYGGEILGLSVGATTGLTAIFAIGSLAGFAAAARRLSRGAEPYRLAAVGGLVGVAAFSVVVFSGALGAPLLFQIGAALIGFGAGLFFVCTLTAMMALADKCDSGIALGVWGATHATATGAAIAAGALLRDGVDALASSGALGPAFEGPALGYCAVYHLEILFLFGAIAAIGPLARLTPGGDRRGRKPFGLAEFPG